MTDTPDAASLRTVNSENWREEEIDQVLAIINHGHSIDCPWLRNAVAPCTCGRLALGHRVEAALRTPLLPQEPGGAMRRLMAEEHDVQAKHAIALAKRALDYIGWFDGKMNKLLDADVAIRDLAILVLIDRGIQPRKREKGDPALLAVEDYTAHALLSAKSEAGRLRDTIATLEGERDGLRGLLGRASEIAERVRNALPEAYVNLHQVNKALLSDITATLAKGDGA